MIAITANAFKEDRDKCRAAGMDDYLSKPLDADDLLAMLETWVSAKSGFSSLSPACYGSVPRREGSAPSLAHTPESPCAAETEIFNMPEFVRRNLGNIQVSRAVAAMFIRGIPEYFEEIREAVTERDAGDLRQSAHKLKGAAANLSLLRLSEIAWTFESFAEAGGLEQAEQLLPELNSRFGQAEEALRSFGTA